MATLNLTSGLCAETDSANTSQVTNDSFDVGGFSSLENESYAYFDVSSLPSGAMISALELTLTQYDGPYFSKDISIRCAPCTGYIANTSVNWNNKPAAGTDYDDLTIMDDENATCVWTISGSGLEDYIHSSYLIFKLWGPTSVSGSQDAKGFRPSSYSTTADRPKLAITYELGKMRVNAGDTWYQAVPYINDGGTWKQAQAFGNVGGIWKNGI